MTTTTVERLEAAARRLDFDQYAVRAVPDYSGRGMLGRTTAGLVIPSAGVLAALAADAAAGMRGAGDAVGEFVTDLRNARVDSLGYDTVVY